MINPQPVSARRPWHSSRAAEPRSTTTPSRPPPGTGSCGTVVHLGAGSRARRLRRGRAEGSARRSNAAVGVRDLASDTIVAPRATRHRRRDRSSGNRLHVVRVQPSAEPASTRRASCCCSVTRSETLQCKVVGLRTDNFQFRSQRAIKASARRDGILRHHAPRRDAPCSTR